MKEPNRYKKKGSALQSPKIQIKKSLNGLLPEEVPKKLTLERKMRNSNLPDKRHIMISKNN